MQLVSAHPAMAVPRQHERLAAPSWGFVCLLVFTMVAVGRIQELVPFFAEIRLGLITGAAAMAAWLIGPGGFTEKLPLDNKQMRYVLGLVTLAVLTIPLGVWPGHSLDYFASYYWKTVMLFVLVLYWCRSVKDIRRMVWVCCLGAASQVVSGLLSGGGKEIEGRLFVTESYDPNDLCLLLVMMVPLAVYLLQRVGPGLRVVVLGMLLVDLFGIILTESRGGFLALLVAGGLMIWRGSWSRSARLVTITVAVLVFGTIAGKSFWDRMETMWDPKTQYDRTYGGRIELWKTGMALMLTHPWGIGIDGFVTAEGLSHGGRGKWSAAHNSFLQVGSELSPAGLILFVLLLGHTIVNLRQVQSNMKKTGPPDLTESALPSHLSEAPSTRAPTDERLMARGTGSSSPSVNSPIGDGDRPAVYRNCRPQDRFKRLASNPSPARSTGPAPEGQMSMASLAAALEISLWAFVVGGFFLSQGYSEVLYTVLGLGVALANLANRAPATEHEEITRQHPLEPFSRSVRADLPGRPARVLRRFVDLGQSSA